MIEVFLIAGFLHWVIAPDRFTAGARTAAGTAGRAAGTGLRDQWASGRSGRKVARTARRDDWHARGGWWRRLLGLERAAVVTGKTAKGTGQLAAAAARPVPAAIRRGWENGQDKHRARTEGKRVPLAVNPPWWHPKPKPVPGQGEDSPQDSPEDRSETAQDSPTGQDQDRPAEPRCPNCGMPIVQPGTHNPCPCKTPTDPPAGTDPAGTTPAIPTQGEPVPTSPAANVPNVELNDLDSTRRFAEYVASLGEDSEFMQIVERCKVFRENLRAGGFGGDVDQAGASFEETAATLSTIANEFFESARNVTVLVDDVRGG